MALVDVDSWPTEFESCNRLSKTLLSQLNQRENKQHLSAEYNRYTTAIQVGLTQYDRELQQLKFKLNEATNNKTISLEEIQQRQRQLETLQAQRRQLQQKYTDNAGNDRAALFQNPSSSATRAGIFNAEEDSDAAPIIGIHDAKALKQQQIDMLEQQNRGLETLSQTLSRQRHLATQLGQEVEDQNDILDNLANTIERVETGVGLETRNISLINRRDSTWGYWMIIFTLMLIIIIVAVL